MVLPADQVGHARVDALVHQHVVQGVEQRAQDQRHHRHPDQFVGVHAEEFRAGRALGEIDKRAYLASLDAIIGWGVQERLAEIACPTLVISADRDYTPVSLKQAYCERIADARLVVVEDSRHATPMDQPEIFNTTLLGFLADIDKTKEQPCSNVS